MSLSDNISSPAALPAVFCDIGRALTASLNPREVFHRIMTLIGDYFAPRNWSLLLREKGSGRLRFEIVMGVDAERLQGIFVEEGEGVAGWVSLHGQPVVVEDVRHDLRFSPRIDEILGFVTRSAVCVPLLDGNKQVIGVIELINKIGARDGGGQGESFTAEDMAILAAIGAFAGIGAENAFLHQRVRELAMTDPLTGLSNRLHFNDAFSREVKLVRRNGHSLCLLMMDVDNMKAINDSRGHLMGDKVLVAVADLLRGAVRGSDVPVRLGGDEFVVLMPRAGAEDGRKLADRIQAAISAWNQADPLSGVRLGMSIGVKAGGPAAVEGILGDADRNLYLVKNQRKGARELPHDEQVRRYLWDSLTGEEAEG
ncbi:MAG: sensor domain-containing diguanylate cyclase [Desulfobulbaceae bacterium]|nr:sensor domain-containing diguanylate cyclase [Desulfobulbaceae bacterium]